MTENPGVGRIREQLRELAELRSPSVVADEIGIHVQVLRDFVGEKVDKPRGLNWDKIRLYFASEGWRAKEHALLISDVKTVREVSYDARAELLGRALEVEALLEFALTRQRLLAEALAEPASSPGTATQPVSRAKLDETGRRQLAKDAAAAQKRRGTG